MASEDPDSEEQLAPYLIEGARSSRSKCRTCKRKIDKGSVRIGILLEGPYGTGYLWHHLTCAARRRFEDVEAAYAEDAASPGTELPPLEELKLLKEKAEEKRAQKKTAPYVDVAPTSRAKCKSCEEIMEKGTPRITLLREVTFGNQFRSTPIQVHPGCVAKELAAEDCQTEADGFEDALRANSSDLDEAVIDAALSEIELLQD